MGKFLLSVVVGGLLVGGMKVALAAQTGVLCFSKSGKITVRSKCLSSETAASLSDLAKKGASGDGGAAGGSGASSREVIYSYHYAIMTSEGLTYTEACPAGKIAVGGGCYAGDSAAAFDLSYPYDGDPSLWVCHFRGRNNNSGGPSSVFITFAICVNK